MMQARIDTNLAFLNALLEAPGLPFDSKLRSLLPNLPGVYRIFETGADQSSTIRAGRTKSAGDGLRQRVYGNHLMDNQPGNVKAQLVASGRCADLNAAKEFLRSRCRNQVLVIEDNNQRKWAEHFMLSILQPDYCN
jgi:hypothetical protein